MHMLISLAERAMYFSTLYVFRNIRTPPQRLERLVNILQVLLKVIMSVTDHGGKCVYRFTDSPKIPP